MKLLLLICAGVFAFLMAACSPNGESAKNGQTSANNSATPVAVSANASPAKAATAEPTLEGMYWTLKSATDGQNKPVEMPTNSPDHPIVFTFTDGMLNIEGPCNLLAGSYTGGKTTPLVIGPLRSTMRGCEQAVMDSEKVLTAMLPGPLQVTLEGGSIPKLRLVNSSNETLSFEGRPTPESLYGPAKIIFLEVAPNRVPCTNPNGETACLQVRDRVFDDQGLPSGEPGPWRPLYEKIEGFDHVDGQRNVIRVKSFTPPGSKSNVYVLDLMVETEIVK